MARIITPEATLSYPNLFRPRAVKEGDDPKYSVTMVFSAETDLTELKEAAVNSLKERWSSKLSGAKRTTIETPHGPALFLKSGRFTARLPWNDDEEVIEEKGYPEGSTIINASAPETHRPQIVSQIPDEDGKPSVITDESQVYPGVIARVSVRVFTYDTRGNKGASFGLGNVQIIRDGERLDGAQNAQDEFEADPDALVTIGAEDDLSDLTG